MAKSIEPGELLGLATGIDEQGRERLVAQVQTADGPILGTLHTNPMGDRGAVVFRAEDGLRLA